MRARNKIIGDIGAAAGLMLALAGAVAPASAGQSTTVTSTYSCASFEGLTVVAPSVKFSGVGLRSGEAITAKVTPAGTGDNIIVFASMGLSFIYAGGPATSGYSFQSDYSTVYDINWSYALADNSTSTLSRTWTFDCSTASGTIQPPATAADDDHDGVANTADSCCGTVLPDSISRKAAGSYYANASKNFVDGIGQAAGVTVSDAGGCSAIQIAKALGLSKTQSRSGISMATLTAWASSH
jgi:hypothetical protein